MFFGTPAHAQILPFILVIIKAHTHSFREYACMGMHTHKKVIYKQLYITYTHIT